MVGQFKDPKKLEEITRQLLGEELSIYCNGELIAAPTVQAVLVSGEFSISGSFTLSEANELKELIKISAE
ncbi:preprotein translocase subunit SecD [compost metagenome]